MNDNEKSPRKKGEEIIVESAGQQGAQKEDQEGDPEETFIDAEADLKDADEKMKENQRLIDALREAMAGDVRKINEIRREMGMPPFGEDSASGSGADEEKLHDLEEEQENLKGKYEDAQYNKTLEDLLKAFGKLPKTEINIVIETGKMPDGEPVKTADGKEIDPEVAKKLAEAAESGVTKLSKALIAGIFTLLGGLLAGIFGSMHRVAYSGLEKGPEGK